QALVMEIALKFLVRVVRIRLPRSIFLESLFQTLDLHRRSNSRSPYFYRLSGQKPRLDEFSQSVDPDQNQDNDEDTRAEGHEGMLDRLPVPVHRSTYFFVLKTSMSSSFRVSKVFSVLVLVTILISTGGREPTKKLPGIVVRTLSCSRFRSISF